MEKEENKSKYEQLAELTGKIATSMEISKDKQSSIDAMLEEIYDQPMSMKVEDQKKIIEEKKEEKAEFDEMTKDALVNAQKLVLQIREESEKEYQEVLLETAKKQESISRKLASMKKTLLEQGNLDKISVAEEKANSSLERVNNKINEFQEKHFELRKNLELQEKDIRNFAVELGIEKQIDSVSLEETKPEEMKSEQNPEETKSDEIKLEPNPEETKSEKIKPEPKLEETEQEEIKTELDEEVKNEDTKNTIINNWLEELERLEKESGESPEFDERLMTIIIDIYESGMTEEFCKACNVSDDLKKRMEDTDFSQIGTSEEKFKKLDDIIDELDDVNIKDSLYMLIKAGLFKEAIEEILEEKRETKQEEIKTELDEEVENEDTKNTLINSWLEELDRLDRVKLIDPNFENKLNAITKEIYESGMIEELCKACKVSDDVNKITYTDVTKMGTFEEKYEKLREIMEGLDNYPNLQEQLYVITKAGLFEEYVKEFILEKEKTEVTKSEGTKPEKTKTDVTKPESTKSKETKPDGAKSEGSKTAGTKSEETKAEQKGPIRPKPIAPPITSSEKISITFDAKKGMYTLSKGKSGKKINIHHEQISGDKEFEEFVNYSKEIYKDFDRRNVDAFVSYLLYKDDKISNTNNLNTYMKALSRMEDLPKNIKLAYNMNGIYSRNYTEEQSDRFMRWANHVKNRKLAEVNKGAYVKFLEKHAGIRHTIAKMNKLINKTGSKTKLITDGKDKKVNSQQSKQTKKQATKEIKTKERTIKKAKSSLFGQRSTTKKAPQGIKYSNIKGNSIDKNVKRGSSATKLAGKYPHVVEQPKPIKNSGRKEFSEKLKGELSLREQSNLVKKIKSGMDQKKQAKPQNQKSTKGQQANSVKEVQSK